MGAPGSIRTFGSLDREKTSTADYIRRGLLDVRQGNRYRLPVCQKVTKGRNVKRDAITPSKGCQKSRFRYCSSCGLPIDKKWSPRLLMFGGQRRSSPCP